MTLFCRLCRPWLVPYSEGESRRNDGALAAVAWTHLSICPRCQAESARLRATSDALQTVARVSRPSRVKDDLNATLFAERVMTRVYRDEQTRRLLRQRQQRRVTTTLSLAFSLAVMGIVFAIYGPPSLARTWFINTFHPVPVLHHRAHHRKPPFPMHDPFAAYGHHIGSNSVAARKSKSAHRHDVLARTPAQATEPDAVLDTQAPSTSVENAREATVLAEEAERARWEKTRVNVVPSPNGARLTESGEASVRRAFQNVPPLLLANGDPTASANLKTHSMGNSAEHQASSPSADLGAPARESSP